MTGWGRQPTGSCAKYFIWPYELVVYAQPRIYPGEWDTQTPWRFWDTFIDNDPKQKDR